MRERKESSPSDQTEIESLTDEHLQREQLPLAGGLPSEVFVAEPRPQKRGRPLRVRHERPTGFKVFLEGAIVNHTPAGPIIRKRVFEEPLEEPLIEPSEASEELDTDKGTQH